MPEGKLDEENVKIGSQMTRCYVVEFFKRIIESIPYYTFVYIYMHIYVYVYIYMYIRTLNRVLRPPLKWYHFMMHACSIFQNYNTPNKGKSKS